METRTTRSMLTFLHPFALPGSDDLLPAGAYELLIEEERLQGLTFEAYRRTGMFLRVAGNARFPGRSELRPVLDADLQQALGQGHDPASGPAIITDADTVPRKEIP